MKFMRIGEVARELGVSVDTVRRWAEAHRLPSSRTPGGQLRFRSEDVQLFRTAGPGQSATLDERSASEHEPPGEPPPSAPSWTNLPPWEQKKAEVEAELAIEKLYEQREQRTVERERRGMEEAELLAEVDRLENLKRYGRMFCFDYRFVADVIRELEDFVTTEQIPNWLPVWEQQQIIYRFVEELQDDRKARDAADSPFD